PNTTFREGSVYVYTKASGGWDLTDRLVAPDAERADGFGSVLAKAGNTLFIGQRNGPLHIFTRDGAKWTATGTIQGDGTAGVDPGCGQYGYCGTDFGITLAAEGDWLLVGSPGAPPSTRRRGEEAPAKSPGVVIAYHKGPDGQWMQHASLQPERGTEGDRFGSSIHLEGDRALIGAPLWDDDSADLEGVGRVTEFVLENGNWTEAGSPAFRSEHNANFGTSIDVSGNAALIGAPGWDNSRGAVLRYNRSPEDGEWTLDGDLHLDNGKSGDRFGSGAGFSGADVWVGAPRLHENLTGTTYVFEPGDDGSLPETPRSIQLEKTVERDAFGQHITSDGDVVVVTSPGMHHQSGAVIVYEQGVPKGQMLVGPPDALGALLGEERICTDGKVGPFDCDEVELLAFIPNSILRAPENARGVRTNDNWGWTDQTTGREYALVGRNDGTSFIDITDPINPVLIGDLPKPWGTPPSQLWRDIKTYKDHAYIVADGAGDHGMQVFDLTRLRDVTDAPELFEPDAHYRGVASSHNIVINEETGFAYAVGNGGGRESCGGGLHMINIQNPVNPVFAGCSRGESGTHDSQCVTYKGPDATYLGREICMNSNGREFEIADVTDKDSPVVISTASSPDAGYIHQGWLTDDHRYFYQDDEADVIRGNVATTRTLVWDLTDLEDPVLVNEFMGSMPASAHNLYLKDGFAYQANYRFGLHVLDIADPENPVEVGFFDTTPYLDGPGFSGAWSTYPFFESGTVIVTSLQEGLFVLRQRKEAF
ncbi:MAG: choice-of-anchor B domain-containing protein, partial [Rhodothermales bacterium]